MAWLSSLGDAAVSPANPLKNTSTVNPDGTVTAGSNTTMSGYTIIEADSMDVALSIAQACPFLEIGGSLEVSELAKMPNRVVATTTEIDTSNAKRIPHSNRRPT